MLALRCAASDHSPRTQRCCPRGIGLWLKSICWESRRARGGFLPPLGSWTGCSLQSPHLQQCTKKQRFSSGRGIFKKHCHKKRSNFNCGHTGRLTHVEESAKCRRVNVDLTYGVRTEQAGMGFSPLFLLFISSCLLPTVGRGLVQHLIAVGISMNKTGTPSMRL